MVGEEQPGLLDDGERKERYGVRKKQKMQKQFNCVLLLTKLSAVTIPGCSYCDR